jgi:hypothetical protein
MTRFWIIGFGKVGRRALARLHQKFPDADFAIVDPRGSALQHVSGTAQGYAEDGLAFLLDRLSTGNNGDSPWIVPALPLHLAYEWIAARLRGTGYFKPCAVPRKVAEELPHTVRGNDGQAYISLADFICPDNCNEPQKACLVTKKPRIYTLYDHLAGLQFKDYRSLVIRSYQLAPGVGGFRGRQLTAALTDIRALPGNYLLSTASKCHGVMHAFQTKAY